MFWYKKKKLKELRKERYLELNKKFKDKHQIVSNWYMKNYLCNNNGLLPITEDGFSYQRRVVSFFGDDKYGKLPMSFNQFATVNIHHDKNFDHYPIEKLLELYNEIEIFFPEPFYKQTV